MITHICNCGECDVCAYNENNKTAAFIAEVTQFFEFKNMTWKQLMSTKDKGVLPSTDGSVYLWTETPKFKIVSEKENPNIGDVWLCEGEDNTIIVFKANYDSSD